MRSISKVFGFAMPATREQAEAEGHRQIAAGHALLAEAASLPSAAGALAETELSTENCESRGIKTRKFRATCPRIEGAYRVGKTWFCGATAWREYHRALAAKAPTAEVSDAYEIALSRKGGAK